MRIVVNESVTELNKLIEQHSEYARLTAKYSDADVQTYLTALVEDEQSRAQTLERLASTSSIGLSVNFHERVEMEQLEALVDAQHESGYFATRLRDGTLQQSDLIFLTDDGFSNILAHHVASRQEIDFVAYVAQELGYRTTEESLIATKPNWINEITKEENWDDKDIPYENYFITSDGEEWVHTEKASTTKIYSLGDRGILEYIYHKNEEHQLGAEDISILYSMKQEVLEAFRFWETTGSIYTRDARAVITRYIGAELLAR